MPDSIKKLTDLFASFPTIGSRTAGRFVFYLIKQPKESVNELIKAIEALKSDIKLCAFCFNPHELTGKLCEICQNTSRNRKIICVVEKETDLLSIENTKKYQGIYFILGNAFSVKRKSGNNLRIKELIERVKKNKPIEIIIALNPTPEGRSSSILVERALKELQPLLILENKQLRITHLAKGLPIGGELEYADEETLESALEGRK